MPFALKFLLSCAFSLPAAQADRRPKVVLIVTDDQGFGDFGVALNLAVSSCILRSFARERAGHDEVVFGALGERSSGESA